MGRLVCLIIFILLVCLFPPKAHAASLVLVSSQSSLNSPGEEYDVNVTVNINVADGTNYYLRGVFAKPNTSSYCGYTWNGGDWFSGPYTSNEGWKNFLPITIINNIWSGTLKVKIDSSNNGCKDSGEYNFKVERFTASSGSGIYDSQNIQTISIVIPTPTVAPTNTPTPTKTPTPTRTPTPTKMPTPTKIPPTIKPQSGSVPTQSITPLRPSDSAGQVKTSTMKEGVLSDETASADAIPTAILGAHTSATPSASQSKKKEVLVSGVSRDTTSVGIFIIAGVLFAACGILIYRRRRQEL